MVIDINHAMHLPLKSLQGVKNEYIFSYQPVKPFAVSPPYNCFCYQKTLPRWQNGNETRRVARGYAQLGASPEISTLRLLLKNLVMYS